ncbi:hypothetical protein ['Chrysanthemum coronarium' phytoplasma]|uniref:Uncharacterized protein n=4 Tax=Candidatus Phytoplasma TaxID=33926 RepID=Q6YRH6_ONYPE|nr:hypothetical protein ['Chrysanthemum coronarium' phytoplasma]BAD04124.1 conserved hypothetical protein [Onion yellows phytoplasma OY-M]GAK73642.1 signal transduction histidine kinase ['Chrysanthemum coronarium' phytoplasma]
MPEFQEQNHIKEFLSNIFQTRALLDVHKDMALIPNIEETQSIIQDIIEKQTLMLEDNILGYKKHQEIQIYIKSLNKIKKLSKLWNKQYKLEKSGTINNKAKQIKELKDSFKPLLTFKKEAFNVIKEIENIWDSTEYKSEKYNPEIETQINSKLEESRQNFLTRQKEKFKKVLKEIYKSLDIKSNETEKDTRIRKLKEVLDSSLESKTPLEIFQEKIDNLLTLPDFASNKFPQEVLKKTMDKLKKEDEIQKDIEKFIQNEILSYLSNINHFVQQLAVPNGTPLSEEQFYNNYLLYVSMQTYITNIKHAIVNKKVLYNASQILALNTFIQDFKNNSQLYEKPIQNRNKIEHDLQIMQDMDFQRCNYQHLMDTNRTLQETASKIENTQREFNKRAQALWQRKKLNQVQSLPNILFTPEMIQEEMEQLQYEMQTKMQGVFNSYDYLGTANPNARPNMFCASTHVAPTFRPIERNTPISAFPFSDNVQTNNSTNPSDPNNFQLPTFLQTDLSEEGKNHRDNEAPCLKRQSLEHKNKSYGWVDIYEPYRKQIRSDCPVPKL